jgi:hypothetical protein
MSGASIAIEDASVEDSIISVKERVFAANRKLPLSRQRLVYRPGPRGIEPLADDETLGGACVARDGTAVIDVLLAELTAAEKASLGRKVDLLFNFSRMYVTRKNSHFISICNAPCVCFELPSSLVIIATAVPRREPWPRRRRVSAN